MNGQSNNLSEKMRHETERFLSRASRWIRDPREPYRRLIEQLNRRPHARRAPSPVDRLLAQAGP
jgi:hypothetical protein